MAEANWPDNGLLPDAADRPQSERPDGDRSHADVDGLSFEAAIDELETIVRRLEEGKVPLEESVQIYERGEVLRRRCEQLLRTAEARVEKIALDAAGRPRGTEPFDDARAGDPRPGDARPPAQGDIPF